MEILSTSLFYCGENLQVSDGFRAQRTSNLKFWWFCCCCRSGAHKFELKILVYLRWGATYTVYIVRKNNQFAYRALHGTIWDSTYDMMTICLPGSFHDKRIGCCWRHYANGGTYFISMLHCHRLKCLHRCQVVLIRYKYIYGTGTLSSLGEFPSA